MCVCVHWSLPCWFSSCPPRTFLPALCRIFLDECAPDNVLEVTARAITYYLDVSAECTRRIVAVEGAVKALCNRLVVAEMSSHPSKDLAEQCIKVLVYYWHVVIFVYVQSYGSLYLCYVNLKKCFVKPQLFRVVQFVSSVQPFWFFFLFHFQRHPQRQSSSVQKLFWTVCICDVHLSPCHQ